MTEDFCHPPFFFFFSAPVPELELEVFHMILWGGFIFRNFAVVVWNARARDTNNGGRKRMRKTMKTSKGEKCLRGRSPRCFCTTAAVIWAIGCA